MASQALNIQPYQPVQLPDPIKPPKESPFQGQPAYQFNQGPISKAGGIAGIFDNILRGYVNGKAQGEAHKALTLKKRSDDLNASYNADAQRLYQVSQAHLEADGKINQSAPDFQAALSAVRGSWDALQTFRGSLLEQQEGSKKTRGQKKDQQVPPAQVLTNPSSSPQEKAQALHQMSMKIGPPVVGQIQTLQGQYASQRAKQQRATEDTTAQAGGVHAQNTLTHEQAQATYNKYAGKSEEEMSKLPQAEQDAFKNAKAVLMPPTTKGTARQYESPDKTQHNWFVPGSEPEGWQAYNRPAADATPKVGSFGDFMTAAYGDKPTPRQYEEGRAAWAKSGAGTTTGTHTIQVPQPDGTIKAYTVESTSTKSFPSSGGAASDTRQDVTSPAVPRNPPTVVTQSFHGKSVPGMVEKGNIDIANRPNIDNGDGTHSSVYSMSFGTDKGEVLVPGVGDGKTYPARKLTQEEALDQYKKTGANLGTFKDEKSASAYAEKLHEDQEKYGNKPSTSTKRSERPSQAAPGASPRGVVRSGDVIGGRKTQAQNKADDDVVAATKLNSLAVQAIQSNEPGQQRQLALDLIKAMAGRVNMQEYAIYTKNYGVANTVDGLIKMAEDGRMPKPVVTQLARDAYANLKAAKDAQKAAYQAAPSAGSAATKPERPKNVPSTYTYFQASDGTGHWIDPGKLDAAKKIDPKLQVIE